MDVNFESVPQPLVPLTVTTDTLAYPATRIVREVHEQVETLSNIDTQKNEAIDVLMFTRMDHSIDTALTSFSPSLFE